MLAMCRHCSAPVIGDSCALRFGWVSSWSPTPLCVLCLPPPLSPPQLFPLELPVCSFMDGSSTLSPPPLFPLELPVCSFMDGSSTPFIILHSSLWSYQSVALWMVPPPLSPPPLFPLGLPVCSFMDGSSTPFLLLHSSLWSYQSVALWMIPPPLSPPPFFAILPDIWVFKWW